MKNKKIFRTFAALCTCLMLMGGFSVHLPDADGRLLCDRLCPGH